MRRGYGWAVFFSRISAAGVLALAGCGGTGDGPADGGRRDAATIDAARPDGGRDDAGPGDGGPGDGGRDTVDVPFGAFPTAEGFGAEAVGGRGGRVIQVTSLDDAGPGSLRAACEAEGPRTVVFRVGGTITVSTPIVIDDPFITIAGHTAPGDGILVRGNGARSLSLFRIRTHDVILRHLRLRRGPSTEGGECVGDAIQVDGELVMIDHVSASWTTDQLLTFWPARRTTVQHSILAEALHDSTHSDDCTADGPLEPHALGPIIGAGSDRVTFYRNVFANNVGRNPAFLNEGGGVMEAVNNLVYNVCYAMQFNGRGDATLRGNAIGNLIMQGPHSCDGHRNNVLVSGNVEMFVRDNLTPARDEGDDEWMATSEFLSRTPADPAFQVTTPAETPTARIMAASEVFARVPEDAGARLAAAPDGSFRVAIDAVDARVLADVRSGTDREGTTGRRLDHPDDVGGWPTLADGTPYEDADADGMADVWETAHGLSPSDPEDRNADPDEDGYTNLEEYLNGTLPG